MKPKPTKKIRKSLPLLPPSQRSHVPKLAPDQLAAALERLRQWDMDADAKQMLGAMLNAASNPAGETPEAIIPTLHPERQANIRQIGRLITRLQSDVTKRGNAGLAAIPEDEWTRLVDSANE